jgi:DNA-binding Lrp family transcriptional regulator
MVPFFVQFKCKLGQSYAVANALAEAEIASEIYSTAGDYDLLVKFYVDNDTDIGHFVNEKVQVIPGIQDTHTIITFKAFGLSTVDFARRGPACGLRERPSCPRQQSL